MQIRKFFHFFEMEGYPVSSHIIQIRDAAIIEYRDCMLFIETQIKPGSYEVIVGNILPRNILSVSLSGDFLVIELVNKLSIVKIEVKIK